MLLVMNNLFTCYRTIIGLDTDPEHIISDGGRGQPYFFNVNTNNRIYILFMSFINTLCIPSIFIIIGSIQTSSGRHSYSSMSLRERNLRPSLDRSLGKFILIYLDSLQLQATIKLVQSKNNFTKFYKNIPII